MSCCHCNTDRAEKMLATALDMEKKGLEFYEKTMATCQNDLGKRIFTMLKNDEVVHAKRIQVLYEKLKGEHAWADDWKAHAVGHKDLDVVFKELAAAQGQNLQPQTGDLEALDVGIDFERRAVTFYMEQLTQATDPIEREFVQHMIHEEQTHWSALADLKFFLQDPSAWFREQERGHFDGGGTCC